MKVRQLLVAGICAIMLWVGLSSPLQAQGLYRQDGTFLTLQNGPIAPGDGTVLNVEGWGSVAIAISGITTATVDFRGTVDGATWELLGCYRMPTIVAVSSTTSNGMFFCSTAGLKAIKVPVSSYTAGTIVVRANRTTAGGIGGGGGPVDANGYPLFSLGSCISGESACVGTSPNSYLMVTGASAKLTSISTGVTTNTTSAAFSVPSGAKTFLAKVEGTGAITQTWTIYGAYDTTAAGGDSLCVITLNGTTKDYGTCDSATQVTRDYAYYYWITTNTTGTGATGELVVYTGLVGGGGTGGAGDASAANQTTMITALQLIDNIVGVEDAGETAGGGLAMAGTVRRDTMASSAGTTGDNATVNTDANGLLWTRNADPCSALAKTYLPISISTATTTEITPSLAGASTHYYICSLNLVTAAANNVLVADDDSDGCGSPTSGIFGSDGSPAASEGWNFAANGGIVIGTGASAVGRTGGTNRVICILTSAATQLSGMMTVVAAP